MGIERFLDKDYHLVLCAREIILILLIEFASRLMKELGNQAFLRFMS